METTAKNSKSRYILIVVGCCLLQIITYFTSTAISLYYNSICAELGFESAAIKAYYTIAMVIGLIAGPIVLKSLFPKWGARKMLAVFGTIGGVAYFALGFSTQLWHFYVLGAITGIGLLSCIGTIANILVQMWFLDKNGLILGISTAMTGVAGIVFSTPLATIIGSNWRNGYYLTGIIIVAIIWICIIFLIRDNPQSCGMAPYGLAKYMEKQKAAAGSTIKVSGVTLKNAVKTSAFWILIVAMFIYGFLLAFTQSSVMFFMEQGFSITQAAGFLGWLSGSLIVWKLFLGWLADKIGAKWAYIVSLVITFIGFALQIFVGAASAVVPYIFIICYGCGISVISVLNALVIKDQYGMLDYSGLLPVFGLVAGGSNAVCVMLWDVLYGITNSYTGCAWIAASSAIILIVGLLLSYGITKGEKFQALVEVKE